ncbi:MAG: phosphatidate cytidylyltransferase [Oscillospiraceae bacterium]
MKTRVIVAVIAVPILFLIILFAPGWVLGLVMGLIAAGAAWELMKCAAGDAKPRMLIYTALAAFSIPFFDSFFDAGKVYETVMFALFALMFCELMWSFRGEERMKLETVLLSLLAGAVMPTLIGGIVRLGLRENGVVYVFLPFIVAFSCDSGAYFVGIGLGRHKLAPHLSPNKTIEGSIGGFVCAVVFCLLYGLLLKALDYQVKLAVMAVYGFLGALACQLGDLSFSAIKRLYGIKDYGNLIPGHGGMLDRFDSMFWVAALVELLVSWVPAISKIAG